MSVCINPQLCGTEIKLEDIFKAGIVKDANGCHYLVANITTISAEDCANYTPAIACGSEVKAEDLAKLVYTTDDCDRPVINILAVIEA